MNEPESARIMAGIPASNNALYRRIRFIVGDPAAIIELPTDGGFESTLILRDIEMHRARQNARADHIACPADYPIEGGLSGDRETATAQACGEFLRRAGVEIVVADRSLPLIYSHAIEQAGVKVRCDPDWGILERRQKDAEEIEHLREAQRVTEGAIRMACELIANADARADGVLIVNGGELTSERVRAAVDVWLLERGYSNPGSIIACGPQGADCHNEGSGSLRTGAPVIVDIFPRNRETLYNGDCTRTVVHGEVSEELARMHDVVVKAKQAATAATRPGVSGEDVHRATIAAIEAGGYRMGLPKASDPDTYCAMVHGTGHGIGLDVHEPPLLDFGGPKLLVGDALTIEPGLYSKAIGGVRVEDMVIVSSDGCINLNELPEGLYWS